MLIQMVIRALQLVFLALVLLIIVILRVVELVKHTRFYSR